MNAKQLTTTLLSCTFFMGIVACDSFVTGGETGELKAASVEAAKVGDGAVVGDTVGRRLFADNCSACHDNSVGEAPLTEALKKLTVNHILTTMNDGIMIANSEQLTPDERVSIAEYLGTQAAVASAGGLKCAAKQGSGAVTAPVHITNWGFGVQNERAIKSSLITAENVESLTLDWVFAFPNAGRARAQPTIVGETVFTASQNGKIYALDLSSGCMLWEYPVEAEVRSAISVDTDADGRAVRLYFGDFKGNIYGFDIETKQLLWKRLADPHPNTTVTGSLTLFGNRLYVPVSSLEIGSAINSSYECCTFRGSILALDKLTGEIIWQTYTTDMPVEQGRNSEGVTRFGPSGAPVWSSPTIDAKRERLYVGTGENYSHPTTQTSDAIIALSLATGAIEWISQVTPDDAWNGACGRVDKPNCPDNKGPDFDIGAPPVLTRGPSGKDIILAGQKSGRAFAFDPDDKGRMLWQRQVGRGGIMGGIHWGMATDRKRLYVPVSDISVYDRDAHKPARSGLHALDMETGNPIWSTLTENICGDAKWRCSPGIASAVTVVPGVIFGGGLDGILRAFDANTGTILWETNTNRKFRSVNGIEAEGGSFDSDGPVVVGGRLLVNSGYDKWGQKFGNVLVSYKLNPPSRSVSEENQQ